MSGFGGAAGHGRWHGQVALAMVLISISYPLGEAIARALDPALLMLVRFGLATLVLAPMVALRHGLAWPGFRAFGAYGLISASLAGFFWCMFEGLRTTSALNTAAISTTIPGFTALVGAVVVGERLGRHRVIALGLGMVGALWVVFRGEPQRLLAFELNRGDLIVFAGCVAMGFYSPFVKRFHRGEPVVIMTFWVMGTATLWFLLIGNTKLWSAPWAAASLGVYGGLVYLALIGTIVVFFLMQSSTLKLGPTRVQSYSYLIPSFVLVIDWAVGKGWPSAMTLPGIGIVLIASLVIQRGVIGERA